VVINSGSINAWKGIYFQISKLYYIFLILITFIRGHKFWFN